MKKYIVIFLGAFLSCNAMQQDMAKYLELINIIQYEEAPLLQALVNQKITEESFENIKDVYAKLLKRDSPSADSFLHNLYSRLAVHVSRYESQNLKDQMIQWLNSKLSKRTKSRPRGEPE